MAIYFIGDLHLCNKNQTKEGNHNWDNRPFETVEEMNRTILENHNKRGTNGDTTVFVGDMSMKGRSDELIALVAQMKGKKILVKGNHDSLDVYRYVKLFNEICDYKEMTIAFGGKAYKVCIMHSQFFAGTVSIGEPFCSMLTLTIVQRMSFSKTALLK